MAEASAGTGDGAARLKSFVKSPRSKRVAAWALILFVLFGLFGYFAAPPLVKSLLVKQLSQQLHREVSIAAVAINPYALSARVDGFAVHAADGREVAAFDALRVKLSAASLFKAALVVNAIRLDGLRLEVVHEGDGRYDISDLLDEWSKPSEKPSAIPRFSLNNIELVGGRIVFDDRPKGVRHEISDINLALPFLSSLPYQAEILVEPRFSARVDGSLIELQGHSTPFDEQRASELNLKLDGFELASIQPYLPTLLPLRITSGRLDSSLKIVFKEVSAEVFSLAVRGGAKISALAVDTADGQPLLGWKELAVDLDQADLINRKIAVRRVTLDSPEVGLRVSRQGEFNVLKMLDGLVGGQPATPPPTGAEAPALTWSLGEFALDNGLVRWNDESTGQPVAGELRQLQARVGRLDSKLAEPIEIAEISYQIDLGERFRAEQMSAKGLRVDLPVRRIDIAEIANSGSRARLLRNREGAIEWINPPVLKTARAGEAKSGDERPWIARVESLSIDDLALRFEDRSTTPAAVQELTGLRLSGESLGNEPGSQGRLSLEGQINQHGSLKVDGTVQLQPLDLTLAVETQAIPLLPLQPYFAEQVNVQLKAGQFSNKGEASIRLDDGGLQAGYRGSATLGNVQAVERDNRAGAKQSDFLRWKSLYFGGVDFRLEPLAIDIGEIALSDFFARMILNDQGRLNLQDIVRRAEAEPAATGETPAPVAAAPATPAQPPVPVKIAKITLQNGTINFSDHFVKPNYTVNVTQLAGRVTGLSSQEGTVADLDLRGAYAKASPVQIQGKLNPLAAKSYLDLKASVKGVDLTGFSPYSGKYAGYAIEKGLMSLDLAYKLENNQLTADNKIFIDQFTFGEPVASPDATQLPVNLAIALLKNNRGEIDINLPISGSLDDPQFSMGGLIVRVIVNLFVKAVTSPFALLGSMFGDGEELSKLDFEPGRARLGEAQIKTLETLVKALNERQGLKLEISGTADPETDREGLKQVALERSVRAAWRQDKPEADGREEMSAADYQIYLTQVYKAAKFPKPRNMIGFLKDLPVEDMEKLILAHTEVQDEDIRLLARRRAENVQAWLVEQGKIAPERLFLVPPKDGTEPGARVDFALK
ncbi:MAG: DUF748 domain-containing protein [Azonexus sp.]|jgi:uncharacterized protein involved in outer membrane biogenesis|uniref:DUF748 domain-containing protein n=1 Tax=Azonexus sp. TaxID=1872668 RepID=UPI002817DBB3|nr:DUF748 domain-containing protein [Azonexus sp.]MDR0776167.1 DUF748 domain-containing protein [Azonexus sp.]